MEPIAIVGTGFRFPGSCSTPSRLWDLLHEPRDVASKVPKDRFNIDSFYHPTSSHNGTTNVTESYFLTEDVKAFDSSFFNMSASEAECMDPQQRLLLETVYEALEAAGIRIEDLRDSSTGVFCGVMCDDFSLIQARDINWLPRYAATGTARSIIPNRVSYFFDWHGPSMAIDTACSSSLVAVDLAAKALRDNDCRVAVACGTNLILAPNMYVSEANLSMLSPRGRGRMWDVDADGYARGEGIATVVLKKLSDALADGDPIDCIIRATQVNQDGRTTGITMPSGTAQTALIRSTYNKAGLDPVSRPLDRCQYFEAHGTGTAAGDPQEASAIYGAFFSTGNSHTESSREDDVNPLYVGSVKTLIGHTEGTAGLAGLIKASLCLQHGVITPNLHFRQINPDIQPFFGRLRIPSQAEPWPALPDGVPRRASVNSFGFGGTNTHVILESYTQPSNNVSNPSSGVEIVPFVFSAHSEKALQNTLAAFVEFLDHQPEVDAVNLAWTLFRRRSVFSRRLAFTASSLSALRTDLEEELVHRRSSNFVPTFQRPLTTPAHILGVFTGQGAQWAQMGADLLTRSPSIQSWLESLQAALDSLSMEYRPSYSLLEELSAPEDTSRIHQAAIAQPLCTAVQIILVKLLRSLGITFSAVVGHSSGEIAAAYAAGIVTESDAIRIAHLRGLVVSLAGNNGIEGRMLATGMSADEAHAFCQLHEWEGRVKIAAMNSPSSVTLSGDADAIEQIETRLKERKQFARMLKVRTAYHSHHMLPCSDPYVEALQRCQIHPQASNSTAWFSSVYDGEQIRNSHLDRMWAEYWRDNMAGTVMFTQAVTAAMQAVTPDLVIEVGPHPTLKGPVLQTISSLPGKSPEPMYVGLLHRFTSGIETFSTAIGDLYRIVGPDRLDLESHIRQFEGRETFTVVKDLPPYPFDRTQTYWAESRYSKALSHHSGRPNPLLGTLTPNSTNNKYVWCNILHPRDMAWLNGHMIQSQAVFPATGYAAMAIEAVHIIADDRSIQLLELYDLHIKTAIAFGDESSPGVEVLFHLDRNPTEEDRLGVQFTCYANIGGRLQQCASGHLVATFGKQSPCILPKRLQNTHQMATVDMDAFYQHLDTLGHGYTDLFRGMHSVRRKQGVSSGCIWNACQQDPQSMLIIHPALMDTLLQGLLPAAGLPEDGQLHTLHVPTRIDRITINPFFFDGRAHELGEELHFDAEITQMDPDGTCGDVALYDHTGNGILHVECLETSPLARPTAADDRLLFSKLAWGPLHPDGRLLSCTATQRSVRQSELSEQLSLLYMQDVQAQLTAKDRANLSPHGVRMVSWIDHTLAMVRNGTHPTCQTNWLNMDLTQVANELAEVALDVDSSKMRTVGQNLLRALRHETSIREELGQTGLLSRISSESDDISPCNEAYLAPLVQQIAFRFPRMKILEIGAGTGSATGAILDRIGQSFHSYTLTDPSGALIEDAQKKFAAHADKFIYRALDIGVDPAGQGFESHSYDLVVAAGVLHATPDIQATLTHVRSLLKPGGYLAVVEGTNTSLLRPSFVYGSLDKWWPSEQDKIRPWGPMLPVMEWDSLLKETGFSGVDTFTSDDGNRLACMSVFISQAVDDTVRLLRQPLRSPPVARIPKDLIILGCASSKTTELILAVKALVEPFFRQTFVVDGLDDVERHSSWSMATVLSVLELDQPSLCSSLREQDLESLQTVLNVAQNLLWVSAGSLVDNPAQTLAQGFLRCLRYENTYARIQHLNVLNQSCISPQLITETLLRLVLPTFENQYDLPVAVWTIEPELRWNGSMMECVRIIDDVGMNERYMSKRRNIEHFVNLESSNCEVTVTKGRYNIVECSQRVCEPTNSASTKIRVRWSTLSALRIDEAGFLYVVIGQEERTLVPVIALSRSLASTIVTPASWTIRYSQVPDVEDRSLLSAVAWAILAISLVRATIPGTCLLVHGACRSLRDALKQQASVRGVQPLFTTSSNEDLSDDVVFIHPSSTYRRLKCQLRGDVSRILQLDGETGSISRHFRSLYPNAVVQDITDLCHTSPVFYPKHDIEEVGHNLNRAYRMACPLVAESIDTNHPSLPGLQGVQARIDGLSLLNWREVSDVPVRTQSASADIHLSPNKTYLLIGMTGDLGRSVCEWMVSRGARHIVLASRRPQIKQHWFDSMSDAGACVAAMAMDVTDKESILTVDADIRAKFPPLGGVVNGAMVIKDQVFATMSWDILQQTLMPKVQGSLLLDEVFGNAPLDFFIMFGSFSAHLGNIGQSAYAAANGFMASLVERRRARGQVGSMISPGSIQGVGYLSRAQSWVMQSLRDTMSDITLSAGDIHELLAEAIVAGRPDACRPADILAGLSHVSPPKQPDIIWYNNPKTWHHVNHFNQGSAGDVRTTAHSIDIKTQLETVTSKEDMIRLLEPAFISKVRRKLQLPDEEVISRDAMLVELGVDSLVAVELRTWFVKDLGIDLAVLQLLSGASIGQLVEEASGRLVERLQLVQDVASPAANVDSVNAQNSPSDATQLSTSSPNPSDASDLELTPTTSISASKDDIESSTRNTPSSPQPIAQPEFEKIERLSFSQARFWFLDNLLEDKTMHNIAMLFSLDQVPRVDDLKVAVNRVGMRHEALRTCFLPGINGTNDPCQAVMSTSRWQLEVNYVHNADAIRDVYERICDHVYDLAHGDVAQICLVMAPHDIQVLIIGYHHICLDAASVFILFEELEMVYQHRPLPALSLQYPALAAAQHASFENGAFTQELEYWRTEFADLPGPMPLLPMCRVRSRTVLKKYAMTTVRHSLPPSVTAQVQAICRRNRTTPFNFYMAVLWVLLARLTDTDGVCIGFVDTGRADASSLRTVGFQLNILPIRLSVDNASQPFRHILELMDGKTRLARANSRLPYDAMLADLGVTRSTAYNPLFQVLVDWQPQSGATHMFDDIKIVRKEWTHGRVPYDIMLQFVGSEDGSTTIDFHLQEALFSRRGADLLAQSYGGLVQSFVNSDEVNVMQPPLYQSLDIQSSVSLGRGRLLASQWPSTISKHIDHVATSHPARIAVQDAGGSTALTYSQLMTRVNVIASELRSMGVGPGSRVCLFQHPTAGWISCMLAIWRLNATYVPLDLRNPLPRLATIIQACQPQAMVCHDDTEADVHRVSCPSSIHILNTSRLRYDTAIPILENQSTPEACCAVLHSSGTTGQPKGICLRHSSLRNAIEGDIQQSRLGSETALQQSALTFDLSLMQALTGLATGGRVIVVPRALRGDPVELANAMLEGKVTYTVATPSEYATWLSYGGETLKEATNWRIAYAAGEILTRSLGLEFQRLGIPGLRLFNVYGPSETLASHSTEVQYQDLDPLRDTEGTYSVGKPLPNYTTYIVDKQMRPVPQGVSGEVLIGGAGVGLGYLNLGPATEEKFIPNSHATQEDLDRGWTHMYRTSDRGRLLPDGTLAIEGRIDGDTQVKLRGIRIELQDIEHGILQASRGTLIKAVASLRGEADTAFLAAHVEFDPSHWGKRESLLEQIRASLTLPQYMWPAIIVPVEQIPLNIHGKVDRHAVKALSITVPKRTTEDSSMSTSLTRLEGRLRQAWAKVLPDTVDISTIAPNTDFFLVGGNSLSLIKLQATIAQDLGARVPVRELMEANQLGDMAQKIAHYQTAAPIDWQADTSVDDLQEDNSTQGSPPRTSSDLTVVLTGATGFLGSRILQGLAASPHVGRIHAIAVRSASGHQDRVLASTSSKVTTHYGDLAAPLLGLNPETFASLAEQADRIVHCGANRSFWDAYPVVRAENVHSTRTLIRLGQRRQVPLHFISSGQVTSIPMDETPPFNGADGHLASKWASERLLTNAAERLGLPVCIHRPVQAEHMNPPPPELEKEFHDLIFKLESVPTTGGLRGSLALMPLATISDAVVAAVVCKQESKIKIQEHVAEVIIREEDVKHMPAACDPGAIEGFPRIPATHWIGRAKKEAGFTWWIAGQDTGLEEEEEGLFVSTRR
ncbi:hypothetical protein ANOM_003106 [Aspergillus nomiae NRRL 13137]|uniref:Polyketide synthase n=1 Tax=Aspergillus nomiae NRRL (strain ATCC 15546 / NRRL 13137 / CBS 260.88 / M93) TaxID=1509407 RepID=A0A0L1JAF7_ASPN3|nr:uncharacterized protein ANOM_003106 [Aspergillus nomiae NRRL 13137]KNG88685.1 hypothetical protein ANOM_003106 [Aspergillus nomiae NRRL 13137]